MQGRNSVAGEEKRGDENQEKTRGGKGQLVSKF